MENFDVRWQQVLDFFKEKFTQGEIPQMDTILFLIGIQELGVVQSRFTKDEKLNLMHIATCKLLEPYGFYKFTHIDDEGWPHYNIVKSIEVNDQEQLMKEAIVNYFDNSGIIF